MSNSIYTIGHSNHPSEMFVKLLIGAKIEILVDVRSSPGSPWAKYANPRDLERILKASGIQYLYLGDVLGGRPGDQSCYNTQTGKADYDVIRNILPFKQGISRLLEGIRKYRICLMCAEEDPSSCHRNLLVGESLRRECVQILHIRATGQIQTDEELWKEKIGVEASQLSLPL